MIEIDNETYAAVQTLGKDVVAELARGLVRARKLHPVFAESAAEGAAVVYTEASELVASVHDREPAARQRAEALDTAVTAIRYMGKFGAERPAGATESLKVAYDSDDDFEGVSEAPATLYEMMEQTAQEAPDMVNHPSHYTAYPVEVIDMIRAVLGPDGFEAYCLGNEIKYRMRAGLKGDPGQDLAKAMKYKEFRDGAVPVR